MSFQKVSLCSELLRLILGQRLKGGFELFGFVSRFLGSQGLPWQGFPLSPKWRFPPRNGRLRFWELAVGKSVANGSVMVAGLNPPGDSTEMGIFPLFGEYLHTAEPRGWVLAQVAKSEGFTCGQLV